MAEEGTDIELGSLASPPAEPAATSGSDAAAGASGELTAAEQKAENKENQETYAEATKEARFKTFCNVCLNLYMCECCGHKYHMTEVACMLALGGCIVAGVFVMQGGLFPKPLFSILVAIYALFSIIFVWDYVKISSLAAIASRLEGIAKRAGVEAMKYRIINDSLEDQTKTYKTQLGLLGDTTAGIDAEVDTLNSLIPKLEEMQATHEDLNKRQIELGDREEQFACESRLAVEDKAKELVKAGVKVLFETFPKAGAKHGVTLAAPDRREAILGYMRAHNVPQEPSLDALLGGGGGKYIFCHDLVSYIDEHLSTRFFRLKFAADNTRVKEREVEDKRTQYEALKAKGRRIMAGELSDDEDKKKKKKKDKKDKKDKKGFGMLVPSFGFGEAPQDEEMTETVLLAQSFAKENKEGKDASHNV